MPQRDSEPVTIEISGEARVSGLLQRPPKAKALYVLAHGAGAGMTHPSLTSIANGLVERGIAVLRYQFLYMDKKTKRPDPPKLAQATVRAAVAEARRLLPKLPLFAGGKSFGGRMTSGAQAAEPLAGVLGLVFLGFPLHPAGKPGRERADHLAQVHIPMLFLSGTRDALAELDHLEPVIKGLGERATLKLFDQADHSFHVPAKSGRKDSDVLKEILDDFANWVDKVIAAS
ncbi:alpha/beta hydrolase family protein [Taklimakanibacter deserti]|uniref:alpha/beta hydrolase family protein n=1 Tax=Taklimakanibacter deserti TaxID=2267839 RepID=UPI000E64E593